MNARTLTLCAVLALSSSSSLAFAQDAPVTDPKAFAETAASSNMFEIESSQLALAHSKTDKVQAFADKMIDDHTAAGEKMKAAATKDGVTPPTEMAEKTRPRSRSFGPPTARISIRRICRLK